MKFSFKALFIAACVLVASLLVVKAVNSVRGVFQENQVLHTELLGQTQKYQQLSEYSASLEIKYKASADIQKDAESKFHDELAAMQGKIKILADATYLIKENARETNNSDVIYNGANSQFVLNEIRFDNGPPVGYVLIFKDGRVVSKLYKSEIHVDTAVSQDDSTGRYSVVSKAQYVLKSPSLSPGHQVWLNKPVQMDIIGGTAEIDPTQSIVLQKRFYAWNPKLNVDLDLDPNGVYPGLGVSLMGYGYTKNDLDYRFLELGFHHKTGTFDATVVPIQWRPINGILSNTYVGPGLSFGTDGLGLFLGFQVGL